MDRLVLDDLFKQLRWRVPGDLVQLEKPGVEPRTEQMVHVRVCGPKCRVIFQIGQQGLPHFQNGGGARRGPVHAPQQLLPRWLYGLKQVDQAGLIALGVVAVGRIHDQRRVRIELTGQVIEKFSLAALVQMFIAIDQLDGHALRIGLTPRAE